MNRVAIKFPHLTTVGCGSESDDLNARFKIRLIVAQHPKITENFYSPRSTKEQNIIQLLANSIITITIYSPTIAIGLQ